MKTLCESVRERLAESPDTVITDDTVKMHLAQCTECAEICNALHIVGEAFDGLPVYDVSQVVLDGALIKVRLEQQTLKTGETNSTGNQFPAFLKSLIRSDRLLALLSTLWLSSGLILAGLAGFFALFIWKVPKLFSFAARHPFIARRTSVIGILCIVFLLYPQATLIYLEGSFGALLMVAMGICAIIWAVMGHLRSASAFASLAVLVFISWSTTSTFFHDVNIASDGYNVTCPPGAYCDSRVIDRSFDWPWHSPSTTASNEQSLSKAQSGLGSSAVSRLPSDREQVADQNRSAGFAYSKNHLAEGALDELRAVLEVPEQKVYPSESDVSLGSREAETVGDFTNAPLDLRDGGKLSNKKMPSMVREEAQEVQRAPSTITDNRVDNSKMNPSFEGGIDQFKPNPPLERRPKDTKFGVLLRAREIDDKEEELAARSPSTLGKVTEYFFNQRDNTEGLEFKAPHGYWANTYIPGDPQLRELLTHLTPELKQTLGAGQEQPVRLEELAKRPAQPFDTPQRNAISLYVHSDVPSIQGKTRMLVQVGLQATTRQSGTRPTLRLALVLDLSAASSVTRADAETVLRALLAERQTGDYFTVLAAGPGGGVLVHGEEFRHGTIQVALQDAFERRKDSSLPDVTLYEALNQAVTAVREVGDENSLLGTSGVIIMSGRSLNDEKSDIRRAAYESSLDGISVNTIGTGELSKRADLDQIALAGQGSRHWLQDPRRASDIVDELLMAVSRVVARAIRINIRLAPGVQLIRVIGSDRLDTAEADRAREIEQKIDARIARNFGIESDRGVDDDGIQIIIPAFYSSDSHVILLTVVAERPGAIAEVTAKYKDLVTLRNGSAKASLALSREPREMGPLELNVVKNTLGFLLSHTFLRAAEAVNGGQTEEATAELAQYLALVSKLQQSFPFLNQDLDLREDRSLIEEYDRVLRSALNSTVDRRLRLAASLTAAGKLKVLPRPLS